MSDPRAFRIRIRIDGCPRNHRTQVCSLVPGAREPGEMGAVTPNATYDAELVADAGGVPVVPSRYIPRASLFERLDLARDDRIIIVRGTAGAGKSSLVSAWLRRVITAEAPALWVTAERSTADRAAIWQAVWNRLRDPLVAGDGSFAGAPDDMLPPSAVVDTLERHPRRLQLVIDDFDLVEPEVAGDLDRLLSHNARLSVVITSRATTPLESLPMVRRHLPRVLEGAQLAFTVDETIAAVLASDQGLDEVAAQVIHDATGGWPLGVRLAILEFGDTEREVRADVVAEHVANAAEEVFADIGSARLGFAARVALAPSASTELATVLTRADDAHERLDDLEAAGMGSWRRVDGEHRFVFQPSIRRGLELELERTAPDETPALRRRLADWEDQRGEPFEALRQLSIIHDHAGMSRVLGRHFTYFAYYHGDATLELLSAIPRQQLRKHPVLAVMAGMLYARSDPSPSQRVRNLAQLGMTIARARLGDPDVNGDFWTTFALHGAQRLMGQFTGASRSADRLLTIIDAGDSEWLTDAGDAIPSAWAVAATSFLLVGRTKDARRIAGHIHEGHGLGRYVSGLSLGAIANVARGELAEAGDLTAEIERTAPTERWRGKYNGVGWHVAEAIRHLERWEPTDALVLLGELEQHLSNLEQWPFVLWAEGQARLLSEPIADSMETFGSRLSRFRSRARSPFTRSLVDTTHADLLLAAGQVRRAERILADLGTEPLVEISRSRLDLARGEIARGLARVQPIAWEPKNAPGDREAALVLSAVALARMDKGSDARNAIEHAVALARLHGHVRPFALAARADVLGLLDGVDADIAARVAAAPDPFGDLGEIIPLTKREQMVLEALVETGSLEEIAARLFVSLNTVRTQLRSVYRKLGVTSRVEALNVAARNGLLE